jgi:hypothetical protein
VEYSIAATIYLWTSVSNTQMVEENNNFLLAGDIIIAKLKILANILYLAIWLCVSACKLCEGQEAIDKTRSWCRILLYDMSNKSMDKSRIGLVGKCLVQGGFGLRTNKRYIKGVVFRILACLVLWVSTTSIHILSVGWSVFIQRA